MTAVLAPPEQGVDHTEPTAAPRVRFPFAWVGAAFAVSVLLRLRFVTTPLTSDEGGYLTVARAWAHGRTLYRDTWVDRPQGLVVLFRFWDWLTGGSGPAIRVMAMVFGCIAIVGVAYVAFALAGRRAAVFAALLVAVASANARIEGFIANGELLAGALGAIAIALACGSLCRGHSWWWLFASGVTAGLALSLKQSGIDAAVAVPVSIAIGLLSRNRSARTTTRELATYLGGLAVVVGILVAHGALVGLRDWWYAIAGYRLDGTNATTRADWHKFHETRRIAAPTIVPLLVMCAVGAIAWIIRSRRLVRTALLVPAWLLLAIVAFYAGGLFHRHYWVGLTFPLATGAGIALSRIRGRSAAALAALIALPSLVSTFQVVRMDRTTATYTASGDPRSITNELVAGWWRTHHRPGDTVFIMCASAAFYAQAGTLPPYRYLWEDGVLHARGGQHGLVALFAGDTAPTYVVMYQSLAECNPDGRLARLIRERYTTVDDVGGRSVLRLTAGAPGSANSKLG